MYVVIEIKVKADGTMETSKYDKTTRDLAEKAYHSVLTSAADSKHPSHSATLLNEQGQFIKSECYKHPEQA
jgi:hypothetical protein